MKPISMKWIGAATLTAVVAASGAAATGSFAGSAPAQPGPAERASQAVGSLLSRGAALTAEQQAPLQASTGVAEFKADLSRARAFTPPPGATEKEPWVLIPASDGGACVRVGRGVGCSEADNFLTAGAVVTKLTRPVDSPGLFAPGGRINMSGFVPDHITSIVVFGRNDRKLVQQVDVTNGLFEVDVALQDFGSLEYRDSTGRVVRTLTP